MNDIGNIANILAGLGNSMGGFNFIGGMGGDFFGGFFGSGYNFTITNGTVTGMSEVFGSNSLKLRLPSNATFSVDATTSAVTETTTGTKVTETIQYVLDPTTAGLYHVGIDTQTYATPTTTTARGDVNGVSFVISNGAVTGMQSVKGGAGHTQTHSLFIAPGSSFSVGTDTVTETVVQGNSVETLKYVSSGTAGLYAMASDSIAYVQVGSAKTRLDVNSLDRIKFTIDAAGAVTSEQLVGPDGTLGTLKTLPLSNSHATIAFTQAEAGTVVETISNGIHSSYVVFHDGNHDGIYTEVASGVGTTVDLVGLHAQINAAIDAAT